MKRIFTLIELLVVMAVIGILMGILLPALSSVKQKGKEVKARADMNTIVQACKQYESDYGILPNPYTAGSEWQYQSGAASSVSTVSSTNYYAIFFTLLTGYNYKTQNVASDYKNARNIRYLEIPSAYTTNGYVDPWGYTYGIALDGDYGGSVVVKYPTGVASDEPVLSSVAVYSRGSNPTATTNAKYLFSWK
jgi:prepilin-type N-terminal cleavage/methylation domain-containing protein